MRYLLCFIALVSVYALISDGVEKTFAPSIPHWYLTSLQANATLKKMFTPVHHLRDSEAIAIAYANQLVAPDTYEITDSYVTKHNGVRHVYLRQTAHDLQILNADLNINVWKEEVVSVGSSFFKGKHIPEAFPFLSSLDCLSSLAQYLGDKVDIKDIHLSQQPKGKQHKHTLSGYPNAISDVKVELAYMQVDNGEKLDLVWAYEIDVYDHWWNAMVCAESGTVVALFDWVDNQEADTITAYPIGVNDPEDGGRVKLQSPAVSNASPLGWNDQGNGREYTVTIGNNVYAQENWAGGSNWQSNYRPDGEVNLNFNFPIDLDLVPREYVDSAVTNLFYWNNIIHDVFYQYGFDEESGNFQENNFGRGGLGADAVQANAQDGAGFNNANFATPPDGSRPRMRMYVWNRSTPHRDGDLDSGIIIHEYGHGISNRLTGGPSNVNCLGGGEAGGMGEGWGDWWATAFRQRMTYTRSQSFEMATYDNIVGIRKFPYTTVMSTNPQTYSYIRDAGYEGVHAKGSVWCSILWEVYWNFVDDLGFDDDWYLGEGGNNEILLDVVDGLKLQPCTPNFVQARDAILQADQMNFGGKNLCRLWTGFAKRGLGELAAGGGVQDFSVPSGVC